MSIGRIVKNSMKQQLEKYWVHNHHSPLSQDDLHCYARYKVYYAHWKNWQFVCLWVIFHVRHKDLWRFFSCLLLLLDKRCASVHEHHLQTLCSTGCKSSVWAVVSKVRFLPEALADLLRLRLLSQEYQLFFHGYLDSWRSSHLARKQIFR